MIKVKNNNNASHDDRCNEGLSIVELIIALTLIGIGFVTWLELASAGVKQGTFTQKLADVKSLASFKAAQLARQADELAKKIPKGKNKIGSVNPSDSIEGFFDLLDDGGKVIPVEDRKRAIVKFKRQWMIVKDLPAKGEITVYVALIYRDTNQILRLVKAVKNDGLTETKG